MDNFLKFKFFYKLIIAAFGILGFFYFIFFSTSEKKRRINQLLLSSLILVCFYENLGGVIASQKKANHWVYNIFFFHIATWIHLFIVREFLVRPLLKKISVGFAISLLFFSAIPYALGFFPFNELLNYSALLSSFLMIVSCGLFFYDLLSNDAYINLNIIHFSGFWIATVLLFFYLVNFILFSYLGYIFSHHKYIFITFIKLPMISGIVVYCTFFLVLIKWKGFKEFAI
jgi:hypothetical protein